MHHPTSTRGSAALVLAVASVLALGCGSSTTRVETDAGEVGVDADVHDAGSRDAARREPAFHRASDALCTAAAPPGNCTSVSMGGFGCAVDSDCTAGTNGRCNASTGGDPFCGCTYDTCAHDTECATGQTCACHGEPLHPAGNECIVGDCRVDADCGAEGFCSPTVGGCGGLAGYYCHTTRDLCLDDADCAGGASLQTCAHVSASARWECVDVLFCP